MTILGIDPGTERTGYGIIKKLPRSKVVCTAYNCITTPRSQTGAQRLLILEKELAKVLRKYKPHLAAVETLFFFKNLKTVMPVSQAKGVILLTLAKQNIPVVELSPLQVKMAITGYGRAEKKQVQRIVQEALGLAEIPKPDDAADGLALAIACAASVKSLQGRKGLTRFF